MLSWESIYALTSWLMSASFVLVSFISLLNSFKLDIKRPFPSDYPLLSFTFEWVCSAPFLPTPIAIPHLIINGSYSGLMNLSAS
jgi:hypothetical protein